MSDSNLKVFLTCDECNNNINSSNKTYLSSLLSEIKARLRTSFLLMKYRSNAAYKLI